MKTEFDIIIVGAGLVGLTAAIALSQAGFKTALFDRKTFTHKTRDPRASTLAASSYQLMKNVGLAETLKPHLQPIHDMMIGEGRPGRLSPLTLHFDGQQRASVMAHMIENHRLMNALMSAAGTAPNLTLKLGSAVQACEFGSGHARLILASGEAFNAKLIVAADGRSSAIRRAANIAVTTHPYGQSAIVATAEHEKDHGGVAYQMFFPGGPFAILPLTGKRSSLVWSDTARAAAAALALSDAEFTAEVARRFGDHLGAIKITGPKLSYPLTLQMAESYTAPRLALIGDAAHVVHPIAGQGLNMGLRDVAALTEVLVQAKSTGLDIGGAELAGYAQWRRGDNRLLGLATDQLNTLFTSAVTPIRHLRRLGLSAVDKSSLARRFFMSEAAGETGELPQLLR